MTWFEDLTGIPETSPERVRAQLSLSGSTLTSLANHRSFECGTLEIPSLAELRARVGALDLVEARPSLSEVVADVRALHRDPANADAVFQVASQFNLLEMVDPTVTPEAGVGIYETDQTQGPACAIAAGAGTIFRQYFVPVGNQVGQSRHHQLDCSADLGRALGNADGRLWKMKNGYLFPTATSLLDIRQKIEACNDADRDALLGLLRIGVQWNTQVTIKSCSHRVTQAYCSALPVGYSGFPREHREPFARLVLDAAYEATLLTATLNLHATGCPRVYLTLLGGGVFGNEHQWILDAIERSFRTCRASLDVSVVSYRDSDPSVHKLTRRLRAV